MAFGSEIHVIIGKVLMWVEKGFEDQDLRICTLMDLMHRNNVLV